MGTPTTPAPKKPPHQGRQQKHHNREGEHSPTAVEPEQHTLAWTSLLRSVHDPQGIGAHHER